MLVLVSVMKWDNAFLSRVLKAAQMTHTATSLLICRTPENMV